VLLDPPETIALTTQAAQSALVGSLVSAAGLLAIMMR